ncbi:hypothetical protein T459_04539 [Capsicum annuum]|uniref:Ubiquitin-like protease family profile domain-containing protein n=1 Tax=Capsicum annuum TaxID=4072 RepID=A0A2G3A5A7_CAPAN|nr:hypothetical protein T459_04539 [Capsicum annuum]
MDVNGTPFCLNVLVVRDHDANLNVQLEKPIDEVQNIESTLKVQNAGIYIEELTDDLKNMDSGHEDVAKKDQSFDPMEGIDFTSHPTYIDREESSLDVVFMDNLPQQSPGSLDCRVFIVTYVECLSHEKGIPPRYFDAEAFCTCYAALLWQHGTHKNEIDAVSDDESPNRPVRPQFECESSDMIIIP